MTTPVINLKGRIYEYGPRLDLAPAGLVYVGRRFTMGGWNLPAHPLHNPFTLGALGTPEAAVAAYCRHLLDTPGLLDQVPDLRGLTLACWCAPNLCHAHILAAYADSPSRALLAERADDLTAAAGRVEAHLFDRLAHGGPHEC